VQQCNSAASAPKIKDDLAKPEANHPKESGWVDGFLCPVPGSGRIPWPSSPIILVFTSRVTPAPYYCTLPYRSALLLFLRTPTLTSFQYFPSSSASTALAPCISHALWCLDRPLEPQFDTCLNITTSSANDTISLFLLSNPLIVRLNTCRPSRDRTRTTIV